MKTYEPLETRQLQDNNAICYPKELPEIVHLNDPASFVMLDFKNHKPLTIHAGEFIDDAGNEMKYSNVHLLIVVDDDQRVVGLIEANDLIGEKPLQIAQSRGMERKEIRVRLLMTPQEKISVLDVDELKNAKVAHIIETMRTLKTRYLLVICHQTDASQEVMGLFAASQISKQLHLDITAAIRSGSYAIDKLDKRAKEQ